MKNGNDETSSLMRAVWVFLGYMLLGPFFAGLAVSAILILFPLLKLGALLPLDLPPLGVVAAGTFLWSAIPAAVAAVIVIGFLLLKGRVGWLVAGVAGVLGFAIASLVLDMPYRDALPSLAFLSGLVSMAVHEALQNAKIILSSDR